MVNEKNEKKRTLVIPGEVLSEGNLKAGKNTYRHGNKVLSSQMGFKTVTSNYVNVVPLSGRFIPKPDDLVIGVIMSVSPTTWLVNINSPYPAPLHVTEAPWRVEFGDTSRYLNSGDAILCRVFMVDEIKRVQVTMKDQGSRKLSGGQIIEISPTKVPRVIGKGGSMISLIKQKTMCRLFVGQNGRIWIDGEPEKIRLAIEAIRFIERESHRFGLTEAVDKFLTETISGVTKPAQNEPKTQEEIVDQGSEQMNHPPEVQMPPEEIRVPAIPVPSATTMETDGEKNVEDILAELDREDVSTSNIDPEDTGMDELVKWKTSHKQSDIEENQMETPEAESEEEQRNRKLINEEFERIDN